LLPIFALNRKKNKMGNDNTLLPSHFILFLVVTSLQTETKKQKKKTMPIVIILFSNRRK
jgi:hypothetical protein